MKKTVSSKTTKQEPYRIIRDDNLEDLITKVRGYLVDYSPIGGVVQVVGEERLGRKGGYMQSLILRSLL